MHAFFQAHSYDIATIQGLAFLVLGAVIAVLPRRDVGLAFARDLWLVALFAVLHGAYAIAAPRALPAGAPGAAAAWLAPLWILVSYLPLFEFGRRIAANQVRSSRRRYGAALLRAPAAYGLSVAAIVAVTLWSATPFIGFTAGARYFQGLPGALLTAAGLALTLRRHVRTRDAAAARRPIWIMAAGFSMYGLLLPVLPQNDANLPVWLPTAEHFSAALGFPVALARAAAAVLLTCGCAAMIHGANTGVRRMEILLQESEQRLAEAQRIAKLGRWEMDVRTWALWWSEETFRMFELDPAVTVPSHEVFGAAVHPGDLARARATFLHALRNRLPHDMTYRLLMPDGRIKTIHERGVIHVDAAGKPLRVVGTVQDVTEHVTALTALQESDRRLRALLASAPVILYSMDRRGIITAFEGRKLARNRTDPDAVVGRSVFDEFADIPGRSALFRRGLGGETFTAEVHVDGRWFESWHRPIHNAAGEVDGLVVVSVDVTEQRQAARAIVENRERLATTLRSIGDAVITTDIEGRVDLLNPVAEQLTGWTQAAAKGLPLREVFRIVNESTRAEVESPVIQVLRDGQTVGLANHTALIAQDGSIRPIADSAAPIRTEDGRMLGVVLVFRDQTEERRAEAALRESEARYRRIVEHTNEGIFTLDADYRFTFANPRLAEMLGYPAEQLIGRPILEFISDDERADGLERQRRRTRGLADRHERKYRKADGTLITVQISSVPIFDDAGKFAGAANMAVDITERKHLEQQFLQAQKMEAVGRLAGGIAHDFNNLLTVILGYSVMLQEKLPDTDPLRPYVDQLTKAGERSRDLTHSLLAFSRHQAAQPQALNVGSAVADLEPMLRRLLSEDIEFTTHLDHAQGTVLADPSQIDQVIVNLAVNARDAMPRGGHLTIKVSREDLTPDYAEKHLDVRPGHYVCLSVVDSGEGIPQDVIPHLFEPFFTTKAPGKGTGLGLSTVYGIVRNCGGHIGVQSEAGRGTTFKVYLPEAEGGGVAPPPTHSRVSSGGNETILLVEDDDSVRELVRLVLHQAGYRVLPTRGAMEAMELAGSHRGTIHLLLTDVVMPHGNGRELAKRFCSLHPRARVIFMSGYMEDTGADTGALPPGSQFIQKPVLPDVLKTLVRRTLDG